MGESILPVLIESIDDRMGDPWEEAVLLGEANWARRVDARRLRAELERKAGALPRRAVELRYAVCARKRVEHPAGTLAITAEDVF